MAFDTLENPRVVAENNCIYATRNNQVKITVAFTALDESGKTIYPKTLTNNVWLIDCNASSTDVHLGDSGSNWTVASSPGTFYNYPPGPAREDAPRGGERDSESAIDFYISTDRYISDVQVGYFVKTDTGNIYTCWAGSNSANNNPAPAKFSLLKAVTYSMENCTDTLDAVSDDHLKVHHLHINEEMVPGAYIIAMGSNSEYIVPVWDITGLLQSWWEFDVDDSLAAALLGVTGWFWYFTFPLTNSTNNSWRFNYSGMHLCDIPYNTDGKCVTSAHYWCADVQAAAVYAGKFGAPVFGIQDNFGNEGSFTIEKIPSNEQGKMGDIKYISLT